jgi:hypothetical protein
MPSEIRIDADEELVIRRARFGAEHKPPFWVAGSGLKNRHGESMNVLKTVIGLPASSQVLFLNLMNARDVDTNEVEMTGDDRQDKRFIQNHMGAILRVGLVRRIKRGRFMINPDAVMPPRYKPVKDKWDQLGAGNP